MLVNALSSTRFAPPPASTRVAQPSLAPAHQQREGVTIHPDDLERLTPQIGEMFSALNDALKIQALSDPSINRRALMEELRTQWNSFINRKDGFSLRGITPFPEHRSCQLTLSTEPLSEADQAIGKGLRDQQFDAFSRQKASSTTAQGQELPASPRLTIALDTARLYPHFSLTNPQETGQDLKNTEAVIDIFNEAIKD